MCLNSFLPKEEQKKIKDRIKKGGRKVYKVVGIRNGKYYPLCQNIEIAYKEGANEAQTTERLYPLHYSTGRYNSGYHFWDSRETAEDLLDFLLELDCRNGLNSSVFQGEYKIIECIVKKSWITTIGMDSKCRDAGYYSGICIVAKKAIFPKFREKKKCLNKE